MTDDPGRPDAVLAWRSLRDAGAAGLEAVSLAERCFPWPSDGPASSVAAMRRRSVERAFAAVIWMRAHGVRVTCESIPGGASVFRLS